VAAVQRLLRPETLSTPALIPCYTNLSDQQAPTSLPFQHNTQQSEPINDKQTNLFIETHSQSLHAVQQTTPSHGGYDKDADGSESELTSCNSRYLDLSSPFDRNDEIHNQDTSQDDQLSGQNVTLHQAGTRSLKHSILGSRCSKRTHIEDRDETDVKLDSSNSQRSAGLENLPTPDKSGNPTSQQLRGSYIEQDDQSSRPTVASSTRQRKIAKLPRRSCCGSSHVLLRLVTAGYGRLQTGYSCKCGCKHDIGYT
jgi:hypothetical protein